MVAMAVTTNGQWSHAVPLDSSNGEYAPPQRTDTYGSQDSTRAQKTVGKRPSGMNMQAESDRAQTRRPSVQSNHSLAPRKRSTQPLRQAKQADESYDNSAWIHRDKLAQIEIQEMEDAGMHVRQPRRSGSAGPGASRRSSSRSASRAGLRRLASKEQLHEPAGQDDGYGEPKRKRVSTIPAAEEEDREFDPAVDSEIRTPEEVAAEQQHFRQHMIRPSTSRIPISKASPVPVPSNVVGRDSPLPRSRHGSGAWSGQWDELQYSRRARSGSAGSQAMLDDVDGVSTPSRPGSSHLRGSPEDHTPRSRSPPKARVPNKDTPTSGARKVSAVNPTTPRPTSSSGNKQRARSSTHSNRPLSSAGKSRPSTSHQRPEGDAPWLATMYKPDPRLPPDQQMLPTHAKRMMQEQWQKEGKSGSAYDRDFNQLNDEDIGKPKSPDPPLDRHQQYFEQQPATLSPKIESPGKENASPSTPNGDGWPLGSPNADNRKSDNGSVRPSTSGGYRITPTITTPPIVSMPAPQQETAPTKINTTPRIPDFDEKEDVKEKKGCLGCIIM